MKTTPLRTLLAATCLALTPLARAQTPAVKLAESFANPVPVEVANVHPLPVFNSTPGTLITVVESLQADLEKR